MVVEVTYAEWTPDGLLRHVVYLVEREDKPASDVRRPLPGARIANRCCCGRGYRIRRARTSTATG
jgi:ATP-dependent DNA ligase